MVRFLHTADWQLGMTRHFFTEGVQERYTQALFDAIRRLGQIAKQENCEFVLVCGDAFDSNQVDRRTVARACEALKEISVPVYILPANHDPLNAASVFRSSTFTERKPEHVKIVENFGSQEIGGIELVGAPWKSKKPVVNPLLELLETLPPRDSRPRIVIGHGIVDLYTPDKDAPAVIPFDVLQAAVREHKADFIGLGDRHSATKIGLDDRIWYSGSPVSTDFREDDSGNALVVELSGESATVRQIAVGDWDFVEMERVDLNHADDVVNLERTLQSIENKDRTVVRINLFGGLTISLHVQLQALLQNAHDLFAGFVVHDEDLITVPEDADFADLGFSGFADRTVCRLRDQIETGGTDADCARDALMLLFRLAERAG